MQIDRLKEKDGRKKRGKKRGRDQKQVDFPERGGDARYRGREREEKIGRGGCSPQGSVWESQGRGRKH